MVACGWIGVPTSVVSEGVLKDVHDLYNIAPDRKVMVIVMG